MSQNPNPAGDSHIHRGSPEFTRVRLALFLAGFASFALIYSVQPLLPAFATAFDVSPAVSSLALSLTTGCLALSIMVMGAWSQSLGRKGVMVVSMLGAALINLGIGALEGWHLLLVARAAEGLLLGGVPAVAMAWLAEEIAPEDLGRAMGIYIAGTGFGAMCGRVGMGILADLGDWRLAMAVLGGLCLVSALGFAWLLPPSRNFQAARGAGLRFHLAAWAGHLRNPALRRLYGIGFCLTSIFVTLFNYATFRLRAPEFGLSQLQVSLIFLTFGFGMISSQVAGNLLDRLGRRPLLILAFLLSGAGALVTLSGDLWVIITGIALTTIGFFIAHSVASSAVGQAAIGAKGHAASLYLLFYYAGVSVTGSAAGWLWQQGGWPAVVGLALVMTVAGGLLAAFGARVGSYRG
ncbi:MFS transporter [Pseudogemmobacter bohemicus]|uniref:MFS transporter n=1 Tax=Pseudogemmobacter bohemicus TaxID=2250708 RepID=UPI000DD2F181|nr:MFS transporter [Pseudogemmobacter bohemicus]